eukprot:gene16602-biopygen751
MGSADVAEDDTSSDEAQKVQKLNPAQISECRRERFLTPPCVVLGSRVHAEPGGDPIQGAWNIQVSSFFGPSSTSNSGESDPKEHFNRGAAASGTAARTTLSSSSGVAACAWASRSSIAGL